MTGIDEVLRFGDTVIKFNAEGIFFSDEPNQFPINLVTAIRSIAIANGLIVINDVPDGSMNNQNATFYSRHPFVPESVEVFLNGNKLSLLDDYLTEGNEKIMLFEAPDYDEILTINYTRN